MAEFSDRPVLRDGDRVTVVQRFSDPTIIRRDRVSIVGYGRKRRAWSPAAAELLTLEDEGIVWARGWDTKEADALRVAVYL